MEANVLELREGSGLLLQGPAKIDVESGAVEIFGASFPENAEAVCPGGRQYPLIPKSTSRVRITLGSGASFKLVDSEELIPRDWVEAAKEMAENPGVVIVLGDVNSGKSGFTLYAANTALGRGVERVGIVDSDIGQSDLGPPGTIGLGILERQTHNYLSIPLKDAYFIGDKTPAGHLLPMVLGTRRLVEKALEMRARLVIINTTGMVHGGVARALKKYKVEAVNPSLIIGLQRGSEIEHLLKMFEKFYRVVRLRTPPHVKVRGRAERAEFRAFRMGGYLLGAKPHVFDLKSVRLLNMSATECMECREVLKVLENLRLRPSLVTCDGASVFVVFRRRIDPESFKLLLNSLKLMFREVSIIYEERLKGLLVGLYDGDMRFLGIGRILDLDFEHRILRAACKFVSGGPEDVKVIQTGYLIVDEYGREVERLRPGQI